MAKSVDLSKRGSWRGFRICPSCGHVQHLRKLICGNEACPIRQKILAAKIPYDPVRLITKISSEIYSLQQKENDTALRNFLEITSIQLQLDDSGSKILSKNAICYVDACKYNSTTTANTTAAFKCQHFKACHPDPSKTIPNAEVFPIAKEVLWNLNIDSAQKQRLWDDYLEDDALVPAIQRLNSTTFAVKCMKSKMFPAGRLHVTAISNAKPTSKKSPYACACKKLKIILEEDNSVVMRKEICDHLLLVLSAVLSKSDRKTAYQTFITALKSIWMPKELEKPLSTQEDSLFGLDINIGIDYGDVMGNNSGSDDIFIFDDKFLSDDNFPDFDIVLDLTTPPELLNSQQQQKSAQSSPPSNTAAPLLLHAGDPNLVSSCNITEEDIDICFDDIALTMASAAASKASKSTDVTSLNATSDEVNLDSATQLELSDCNIELMDQFQLTDRIDLCSEDIDFQENATSLFNDVTNSINILASSQNSTLASQSQSTTTTATTALAPITISLPPQSNTTSLPSYYNSSTNATTNCKPNKNSLLKSNHNLLPSTTTTTLEAPPIELPTITVVEKTPVKATEIVSKVKTRKYPPIPAKRALIVNTAVEPLSPQPISADIEPSLSYSAWLEYVIETLNESIEIGEDTDVVHTFHVHEEIFSHLCKNFSVGIKRRMPTSTTVVKSGKNKGLIRYTWHFPTAATVRRIFSTKNITLQDERAFEKTVDGDFIPYVRIVSCDINPDGKKRRTYPKLSLYTAYICFDSNSGNLKTGFKVEWLPNAFPKSHFGILKIEFSVGVKDPHNLGFN